MRGKEGAGHERYRLFKAFAFNVSVPLRGKEGAGLDLDYLPVV